MVTGTTKTLDTAARQIVSQLQGLIQGPYDVETITADTVRATPAWILGVGPCANALPSSWNQLLTELDHRSMRGKLVALFGVDDEQASASTFLDAMGEIYEQLRSRGAQFVGAWPAGEHHAALRAVLDRRFVGLAIDARSDEANRCRSVRRWTAQIRLALENHLEMVPHANGILTHSAA